MTAENLPNPTNGEEGDKVNPSSPQETNDKLINQLDAIPEETKLEKILGKVKGYKLGLAVSSLVVGVFLIQNEEAYDVWRWIKLQAQEAMASGPTLNNDPIGVFSRSFVGYTKTMGELNPELLLPLNFHSITRFKLDAIRFKSEFSMVEKTSKWEDCNLTVEGMLDAADGGISPENYVAYLRCSNGRNVQLEGYELLAYPPEVNAMLAPANYYLYNRNGATNAK
ncbi:hypothetical protein MKR81_26610 (plasmid) [Vibrio campbellii]|uniref:hypothetical protein n=1 Tax=Vibrio campbellii TaxID=680 RepID=UPI001F08748F|nr:hypothetical protein [Vibrio campbellii]UMM06836.1 hypothetical protein MKR81_26610 [Vibrio campbellii]